MVKQYNLKNIRDLLYEGFSTEELRRFCFDLSAFRPVYEQLNMRTDKTQIIQQLLAYVEQKNLFEFLLDQAKKYNPIKYEKYQPYHHDINSPESQRELRSHQDQIKKQIIVYTRRLQKLKEILALKGTELGSEVLIEIEDLEAEITRLQTHLSKLEPRKRSVPQSDLPTVDDSASKKSQKQLVVLIHHLQSLREREAIYGLDPPLSLLNEISETEAEITRLKTHLRELKFRARNTPQPEIPAFDDSAHQELQRSKINSYPTVEETIGRLLASGAIDQHSAVKYNYNYQFFEQNRAEIESRYASKWVASLNNRIYFADTFKELEQTLRNIPDANRAYIEQILGG